MFFQTSPLCGLQMETLAGTHMNNPQSNMLKNSPLEQWKRESRGETATGGATTYASTEDRGMAEADGRLEGRTGHRARYDS